MDVIQKEDRATITEKGKIRRVRSHGANRASLNLAKITEDLNSVPSKEKKAEARKLKKRLLEVAEKNESLAKTIIDRNQEISDLKRSVQSLNEVLNSVPIDELRCNSSIAGSKILELSKKNRILRAELETTKNRVSKKEMEVQKLELELKVAHDKERQTDTRRKGNVAPADEMQGRLNSTQQKLFESRNKNIELQAQLKLALKCLQQEVGEGFNLNNLASSSTQSNWRGRAQQILCLQQRILDLKERLQMHEGLASGRLPGGYAYQDVNGEVCGAVANNSNRSSGSPRKGATVPSKLLTNCGSSNVDRFSPGVRKSELLHRAKVEALDGEITALRTQLEEQRDKILALKVRNKTLNDEVVKYKTKACSIAEKDDYNGLNMANMNEKLNTQKRQFEQRIDEICREMATVVRKREEAEYKEEEMRNKVENLEELISSKDEFIEEQHNAIRRLEMDLKAVCGGFLFSCRELRKEEFIAILDSLEAEKNMLLEHTKTLDGRVEQERTKNENLVEQLSKQKTRICRLEARIRDLERELDVQNERKKRTQRIAEYANSVSSTSLNSFTFENSSSIRKFGAITSDDKLQSRADDLKNQLEFTGEKINLLEEKIANITLEKEQDAKTFSEIIAKTKYIILEAIMALRNGGGVSICGEGVVDVDSETTAQEQQN